MLLPACSGTIGVTPTPAPSLTDIPTTTPTETVEWFPPTSTPTSLPTLTVTPPREDDLSKGSLLYQDTFETEQGWFIPTTGRGSVNVSGGELNIIINESPAFLYSVVEDQDFSGLYAEITASPSLCTGKDEFGMMIRAERNQRYYRYSLSCDGYVRLDRILGQQVLALQPWTRSASVPSAAPSQVRLGVWAVGNELRLYIDGEHQFTVQDGEISRGSVGVFARAVGETAVTVSFSELVVHEASR